jgi:ribose transport system substrate-binding protein
VRGLLYGAQLVSLRRSRYLAHMKDLRFLISLHSGENDFQVAQAECAQETGRKLGVEVEIIFADDDAVNQSTQVARAVQRPKESRPDAIVLEPVGSIALPQVARVASAAGTGWAVLNRHPEYIAELRRQSSAPMFSVGADNEEIGRIQGRQFAALLPRGGSVLYIEGPSRSSSAQKRTAGMLETKPANIQVTTLKANWTAESAMRAVSSWLNLSTSQKASIHLVAAQDDAMAMGARKAFEQVPDGGARQRWLSLPFTGCDGQPATGQVWVRDKLLAATIYIAPLTGMAMEILVAALRNRIQPPEHSMTTSASIPSVESLRPLNA